MAQTRITLAQVNTRRLPNFVPLHMNEAVIIRGVANAPAFHFPDSTQLAIEDGQNGAVLLVREGDGSLDPFEAGQELEVHGTVAAHDGAAVVLPAAITVLGNKTPPAPVSVPLPDLLGFRHLGRLVRTEGRVKQSGETSAGPFVDLEAPKGTYRILVPVSSEQPLQSLREFASGDKVQVAGVAHQYCLRPPFNRYFELLATARSDIVLRQRNWPIPTALVASVGALVLLVSLFLWSRERRLQSQRERLRGTFRLGEEILGASSAEGVLERLTEALPGILGVTGVHLYVYNRSAKTLDTIPGEASGAVSISLTSPPRGTRAGAVACFHYRTLLVIPDISRSPFPLAPEDGSSAPQSLLFVPMHSQGNVIGVLELDQDDRARDFTADEQALAQHLGNQIGVALRLLDQRIVQEQLSRTEKLAAVGRLISGVVNELQTPLSSISELATRALDRSPIVPPDREISAIAAEAQKASAMVARLVSFASAEQVEARPVCITTLLQNLIQFREGDWKASGIRVRDLTSSESLCVLGSHGQLEQVSLNLLVHAEQSLAEAPQKSITIRTSVLARRLLVEIAFSAPVGGQKPEATAAILGVTRSVITGHGGEVRLIEKNSADPRFEVELPVTSSKERVAVVAPAEAATLRDPSRRMTALAIEPEEATQRQILALLSARGFRVVPVANADTGLELAHRMRFDAAFCSVHAPGLNWVELSERMRSRVGGFVLLSDGYDAELAADFEGDGCFVLAKPVQEPELDRILRRVEFATTSAKVIPIKNGVAS